MAPNPPDSPSGPHPDRVPRDESLEPTVDLTPVPVPTSAAERFKSGLFWIAFGMLIVVFDIDFESGTRTVDLVNDVLGFAAIIGGAAQVRGRDRSLDWVSLWAIGGLVFAAAAAAGTDPLPYVVTAAAGITMSMTFALVYLGISSLARRQGHSRLAFHATFAGVLSAISVALALFPAESVENPTITGGGAVLLFLLLVAVIVWLITIPFVASRRLVDPLARAGQPTITGGD